MGDRGVFWVGSLSSNIIAVDGNDKSIDDWCTPSPIIRSTKESYNIKHILYIFNVWMNKYVY